MNKKVLTEIVIAAILFVVELIVVLVCRFGEALNAASVDVYMTSVLATFINIDIAYVIILQIVNSNRKDK